MSETRDSAGNGSATWDEFSIDACPSVAVVSAVAELTDQSPVEMQPLAEVINPDALDDLLESDGTADSWRKVTFDYCDCQVSVSPGELRIRQHD